ncbi:MAG: hypothetical protein R3E31_24255 [Chloroflexota bacterium]
MSRPQIDKVEMLNRVKRYCMLSKQVGTAVEEVATAVFLMGVGNEHV